MTPIHLLIVGSLARATRFIGLAKELAFNCQSTGIRKKIQRVSAGVSIRVENNPEARICKVWITAIGGEALYQFWGSMEYFYKDYVDPASYFGLTRTIPRGYGTKVAVSKGALKATPLVSSVEAPPDLDDWVYDADPRNTEDSLVIKPAHQLDGFGLSYGYRDWSLHRQQPTKMIGSTWAPSHPCHAFGRLGTAGRSSVYLTDIGYDYPAVLHASQVGTEHGPVSDFWRGAAVQSVALPGGGTRLFIIMVDASHDFIAFPADATVPPFDIGMPGKWPNVDPDVCETVAAPWPAWVDLPVWTGPTIELTYLQPRWEFHPEGTRAACVVAIRHDVWEDVLYTSTMYSPADGSVLYTPQEDTPGLVEVAFTITPDTVGDGFTFEVDLVQEINAMTDQRQPVAVAYARIPMPDSAGTADVVPFGALLILEYHHYWSRVVIPGDTGDPYSITNPPRATVARVTANGTLVREWLAYYGCYTTVDTADAAEHPFYPRLHEFPEVGGSPTATSNNHFCFIAQLCSLDLASLSVCLGVSIWTSGVSGGVQKGAEAGSLTVLTFNHEEEYTAVGHSLLQTVSRDMLWMVPGSYPILADMDPFYASTVLSAVESTPPSPEWTISSWPLSDERKLVNFAELTIDHGDGSPVSYDIYDAAEGLDPNDYGTNYFLNIRACGLFPGSVAVFGPRVFSWVDQYCIVRPGIAWFDGGGRKPGAMTFTGYPFGAIHHTAVHLLTTSALANVGTRFSIHPNRSWALFCGPIGAHSAFLVSSIDANYEQTLVDKISIRKSDGSVLTTSHVAMLNEAFGKTLTAEDFYFTLQAGSPWPQMKPQSTDDTPHPWYDIVPLTPIGVGWRNEYRIDDRLVRDFTFAASLYTTKRHDTYQGAMTFPNPRMEGVFWYG